MPRRRALAGTLAVAALAILAVGVASRSSCLGDPLAGTSRRAEVGGPSSNGSSIGAQELDPGDTDARWDASSRSITYDAAGFPEDESALRRALRRELCAPRAALLCEVAVGCGCEPDAQSCFEARTQECVDANARWISGSGLRFVPEVQEQCLDAYRATAMSCLPRFHCGHSTFPVAVGERCPEAHRGRCGPRGEGTCEGGVCRAAASSGEPCEEARQSCATGAVCRRGVCLALEVESECLRDSDCAPGRWCRDGRCRAPQRPDARCGGTEDCGPGLRCQGGRCRIASSECAVVADCRRGERCVDGVDERHECRPRAALGARCTEGSCAAESFCLDGLCVPLGTAGEPCTPWERSCADGFGCTADLLCGMPEEWEPCGAGIGGDACAEGLACVGGACVSIARRGERCVAACEAGSVCGANGRCVRPPTEDACGHDGDCGPAAYCDSSARRCAPRLEVGADCEGPAPCVAGASCVSVNGSAFRCSAMEDESDCGGCGPDEVCTRVVSGGRCVAEACGSLF